jgi:hypothetical protein
MKWAMRLNFRQLQIAVAQAHRMIEAETRE